MGSVIATPIAIAVSILSNPSDIAFWCKWIISYIYIQIARKSTKRRLDLYDDFAENDPVKVDFISAPEEIVLESPLEESELSASADEVFCYGVNSKSEYLVTRIARGLNNEADAWIYLKLSNGKTYQLKQTSGFQQSCCEKKVFSCGDLQMHYIQPMRKWRIFFNGLLRETDESDNTSQKMVHVKFALIWRAAADVFDYTTDINVGALASGLASAKWTKFTPPLEKFTKSMNCYAQCGNVMGTISIEDSNEDEIYLFGEKLRNLGDTSLIKNADILNLLGYTTRNGSFVHLEKVSFENVVKDLTFGYFIKPVGQMCAITDIDTALENILERGQSQNTLQATIHIKDASFKFKGKTAGNKVLLQTVNTDGNFSMNCFSFNLGSFNGAGVELKRSISTKPIRTSSKLLNTIPKNVPLVVSFSEKTSQNSEITGGKGSSLGKLTELSKDFQTFIVPNGMVVTTTAYQKFITKDVLNKIKELENVLYGNTPGEVKEACQRVIDEIVKTDMPIDITDAVESCLQKSFPEKNMHQFAVRSSATGEDTEQMSAAGQMETYLGVTGITEIMTAVKKCWASQFSHIAVQYKKQYGQVINSPMAVVVQKMVPCDVAGVLFTCDPLTGNPTTMSITANYGLGESVVSASEEPDTIELKRDSEDKLYISNKTIGAKKQRIILQDENTGGTNAQEVSEEERQKCCLTDEMALRLGNLAVKIEKSYRSRRDIEWGFWNNNLYIFQSRPVTSGCGETDFEVEHEQDGCLRCENEYFTVCNVGEVMPGALSPLGLEVMLKYFRISFQRNTEVTWIANFKPRYFPRGIVSMHDHVMFYTLDLLENLEEDKDLNEAMLIALFGRSIEDPEMFQTAKERFDKRKKSFSEKHFQLINLIQKLFRCRKYLKEAREHYRNYRIPVEKYKTSRELFDAILFACTDLCVAWKSHMTNTEASSIWNSFVTGVLRKERGGMTNEVYTDLGTLLTTQNVEVESADVPASIDRLARSIAKERNPEEFKEMDIKSIIEWLQNSKTEAGQKYREFLLKHGHRCLKEFDIRSKPWGTNPEPLIKLLKNLVGIPPKGKENKDEENLDKTLSDLGLSLGFTTRTILKYLVSQSRLSVQNREYSKSILIKAQDAWRKGYCALAKLMVSEGRIPDEDLLFFMTLDEIKDLLENRSPKVISRANHRRRRYPTVDGYKFPEIMKGFPRPINMEDTSIISSDENFSMKGVPVSQGVVKGFVRVALTLEEASELQPGEIMVTYSTDIGWSPYFPILAGVVTELGGLISHGAVVSREYGLPCVAGLHGATRQFKTGDYVLLDGNKGILQRLPKPEVSENSSI